MVRRVLNMGAPDRFISHARVSQQRRDCGLSVEEVSRKILKALSDGGKA